MKKKLEELENTKKHKEAAGEWPEFEKSLLPKIKNRDPVRFSKNPSIGIVNNDRKFLVLNGEIGVEK